MIPNKRVSFLPERFRQPPLNESYPPPMLRVATFKPRKRTLKAIVITRMMSSGQGAVILTLGSLRLMRRLAGQESTSAPRKTVARYSMIKVNLVKLKVHRIVQETSDDSWGEDVHLQGTNVRETLLG